MGLHLQKNILPKVPRVKKIIFCHIPKTAGTSIRELILREHRINFVHTYEEYKSNSGHTHQILGHVNAAFAISLGDEWTKTSIIREPIARFLSSLNHGLRDPTFHGVESCKGAKSISDLLNSEEYINQNSNLMTRIFSNNNLTEDFISNKISLAEYNQGTHCDISEAIDNASKFQFIGTDRNLINSVNRILNLMNLNSINIMPKHNSFGAITPTKEELDYIKKINLIDIEFYNHIENLYTEFPIMPRNNYPVNSKINEIDLSDERIGSGWYAHEFNIGRWASLNEQDITLNFIEIGNYEFIFKFFKIDMGNVTIKVDNCTIDPNFIIDGEYTYVTINLTIDTIGDKIILFNSRLHSKLITSNIDYRNLSFLLNNIFIKFI